MPLNEHARRCGARTRSGAPCSNPAVVGSDFCRLHVPPTQARDLALSKQPFKHGAYTKRLVTPEEVELYEHVLASLRRDFGLKLEVDQMQAAYVALYCVKLHAAVLANAPELTAHYDRLIRQNLECLKATREKRDGGEQRVTTPAEWAANLIAEHQKREAEKQSASNEDGNGSTAAGK